ncbi:helix-turn-helix domain-containing protein [Frigoribacterium sp. CG_9.8]|uniref:helix-turn-helix domain-containing protein n=1 Tax=Frigoribacterium sp. CG_9.8 TaxID=2787733 RepID=UPI0018CB4D74|nr:XRE family transcriptional regulator [Frigoribacterium sp. CG_9.8]MBG6106911.1 transcriptional regulator with XRE-family HTH domain [Frigoribacterium sp. CG_9.8]
MVHEPSDAPDASSGMNEAGQRLRQLRLARKLTLLEVAERTGVTKGFLSLLERGHSRVSVPILLRICEAIGIHIGSLFEYPDETVVREGSRLQMGGVDIDEYLLTPRDEELIQVMRTRLRAGGGSAGAYTLAATTIFVTVLQGQLDLIVDSVPRPLLAGESTTFSARLLHEWSNPGNSPAEVLWVIAPPLPRDLLPQALRG